MPITTLKRMIWMQADAPYTERISATVYEGNLPDGTRVAVKKSKTTRPISYSLRVIKEVGVASQIDHINVVRFLGCCLEPQTQALVFKYIPNGTLYDRIHKEEEGRGSSQTQALSLESRIKIASETAEALAYLHSFTPNKPIIHGHALREKSDVYNFGVVLAELLTSQVFENDNEREYCGTQLDANVGLKEWNAASLCWMYRRNPYNMRAFSPERIMGKRDLAWFLSSMENGHLDQILDDEIIVNEATSETAKKVADLGKRCLRSKREERPSMEQVVVELEGLRKFMAEYQRGEDVEPSFS
ncbi:hypothetical protein Pyn_01714 [Prunus yedoensis var. nudiflora]|uniref:Protein kinase domain-containing protein n=1 Tax=Prunus yedoensis var. nudiflora TaxID=2094558 RepID=A0A314XT89_PRUYE|nr:hypothetical protein Pyn_01714 [Prunus yedoensis var. nudiflora]